MDYSAIAGPPPTWYHRSMTIQPKFVDLILAGKIVDPETEIDEWIQRWHESDSDGSLCDWLGITWDEYVHYLRPDRKITQPKKKAF